MKSIYIFDININYVKYSLSKHSKINWDIRQGIISNKMGGIIKVQGR